MTDQVREEAIIEMLNSIPNPWPPATRPFSSAYLYTLTHIDPRSQIPPHLFDLARHSALSISILESWRASEPSQAFKDAVVRILDQVNIIFQHRYGERYRFIIDIFGSVSWGGETGHWADVDMALKDFDRPLGYTKDLWPKGGRLHPDIGPIYDVQAMSQLLNDAGYNEVQHVKDAHTPIVKFKDPLSGISLDLNTNDLGGDANSQMILAYCRLAPFTLRPLIHTVKTWALIRNLNDPSGRSGTSTLSSYCWTLMCIAYMQIIGKLPNLQDPEKGRSKGQAARIGYAEPSAQDFATAEASEDDIGSTVKGFFAFYSNMFRKDGKQGSASLVKHNGRLPDTRHHVISVWQGGLTDRKFPVDSNADKRLQVHLRKGETRMKAPGGAEPAFGGVPTMSNSGDSGKAQVRQQEYFAQPGRWAKSDLVIQDPFVHDKNCASALLRDGFARITRELERAERILAGGQSLGALFLKSDFWT